MTSMKGETRLAAPPRASSSAASRDWRSSVSVRPPSAIADEQAIRLQDAPDLDQRTWQVVHPVQRQRRNDQVERRVRERQGFFIGDNAKGRADESRREVCRNNIANAVGDCRIVA